MIVRAAVEVDIPQMMALADQSPTAAHWTHSDYARITSLPAGANRTALVAEDSEQKILGFIVANAIADDWDIENVVISPRSQRLGLASQLVKALINIATRKNAARMSLEVRSSNQPAIALYEKFGFLRTGVRKNYYTNPSEDAVILRLELPLKL